MRVNVIYRFSRFILNWPSGRPARCPRGPRRVPEIIEGGETTGQRARTSEACFLDQSPPERYSKGAQVSKPEMIKKKKKKGKEKWEKHKEEKKKKIILCDVTASPSGQMLFCEVVVWDALQRLDTNKAQIHYKIFRPNLFPITMKKSKRQVSPFELKNTQDSVKSLRTEASSS